MARPRRVGGRQVAAVEVVDAEIEKQLAAPAHFFLTYCSLELSGQGEYGRLACDDDDDDADDDDDDDDVQVIE